MDINLYTIGVTFNQGEMASKIVEVGIREDQIDEPNEVACFDLTTSSFDASIGTPSRHKLTIEDNDVTGMDNYNIETQIKIMPNPSKTVIIVDNKIEKFKIKKVIITDILSQKVFSFLPDSYEKFIIDIRSLQRGFYFLNLYDEENGTITKKFIKD